MLNVTQSHASQPPRVPCPPRSKIFAFVLFLKVGSVILPSHKITSLKCHSQMRMNRYMPFRHFTSLLAFYPTWTDKNTLWGHDLILISSASHPQLYDAVTRHACLHPIKGSVGRRSATTALVQRCRPATRRSHPSLRAPRRYRSRPRSASSSTSVASHASSRRASTLSTSRRSPRLPLRQGTSCHPLNPIPLFSPPPPNLRLSS
jgi:hypothetical protein